MALRRAYRIQRDVLRDRSAGYTALHRAIAGKAQDIEEQAAEHTVNSSIRRQARAVHQYVYDGIQQREQLRLQQDEAWANAQGIIEFWESGEGSHKRERRPNSPDAYVALLEKQLVVV